MHMFLLLCFVCFGVGLSSQKNLFWLISILYISELGVVRQHGEFVCCWFGPCPVRLSWQKCCCFFVELKLCGTDVLWAVLKHCAALWLTCLESGHCDQKKHRHLQKIYDEVIRASLLHFTIFSKDLLGWRGLSEELCYISLPLTISIKHIKGY